MTLQWKIGFTAAIVGFVCLVAAAGFDDEKSKNALGAVVVVCGLVVAAVTIWGIWT